MTVFLIVLVAFVVLVNLLKPKPGSASGYCVKCGAKVSAATPCDSEVLLETNSSRFDRKTGKLWRRIDVSNDRWGCHLSAKCEKRGHAHSLTSGSSHINNEFEARLRAYSWTFNPYHDSDEPWMDGLQICEPQLHDNRFIRLGTCGIKCCPQCGIPWDLRI